jgi:hypothetical protein
LKLGRFPFDSCAPAHFDLSVCPSMSLASPRLRSLVAYPRDFYVDHSHCLVLAPATLAALPSTRAIPDRDVFYVADPISSIHRSSRINWIRVDSCPFVVTTSLVPWRVRIQGGQISGITSRLFRR